MSGIALVPAGFAATEFITLGADGFPDLNADGTPLADGDAVGMSRLVGGKTSDIAVQETETLTPTGDDGTLGAVFEFDPTAQPSGTLEVGVHNLEQQAQFQNTLIDEILTGSYVGVLQPKDVARKNVFLQYTRRAVDKDDATSGLAAWQQYIMPRARMQPLGSAQYQERAESPDRYRVIVNNTTKFPDGKVLTLADNGALEAPVLPIHGSYRVAWHFFIGDNSEDEVVLNYTPAGALLFRATNFSAGTNVTGTLVVNTRTLTFTAAPAAGVKIGICYLRV